MSGLFTIRPMGSGYPYQHVPEKYKAYCSKEPEKRAYNVRILKNVLLKKSCFKVFGGYKDEKNSYLNTDYTNLAVRHMKYTFTNPAKFIKICLTEYEF